MIGESGWGGAEIGLIGVVDESGARGVVTAHEIHCPCIDTLLNHVLFCIKEQSDRAGFGKITDTGNSGGDGW